MPTEQNWIAYMLHAHPLCSRHPLLNTSYPHVRISRKADYVVAPRDAAVPPDALGAAGPAARRVRALPDEAVRARAAELLARDGADGDERAGQLSASRRCDRGALGAVVLQALAPAARQLGAQLVVGVDERQQLGDHGRARRRQQRGVAGRLGTAPDGRATTGTPAANASSSGRQKPSCSDRHRKADARA